MSSSPPATTSPSATRSPSEIVTGEGTEVPSGAASGEAADGSGNVAPASVLKTAKPKGSSSPVKLKLSGVLSGGIDSNVYERKDKDATVGSGEVAAKAKIMVPMGSSVSWASGVSIGGSYRGGDQAAAKVKTGVRTGVTFLLAGKKKLPGGKKIPPKKQQYPALTLNIEAKYGFGANPATEAYELVMPSESGVGNGSDTGTSDEPTPEELAAAEEEYAVDPELDELVSDFDDDEMDAEDEDDDSDDVDDDVSESDDGADDGEVVDADDSSEDEDFGDEDVLTGASFGLRHPKHKLGLGVKLTFSPWRRGDLSLTAKTGRGIAPSDDGKPSGNNLQYGMALKAKQSVGPFGFGGSFGIDIKRFDDKRTKAGDDIGFTSLLPGVFADLKPSKAMKIKLGYTYQARLTSVDDNLESFKHNLSLMGRYKISGNVALSLQTGYSFGGKMSTVDKDSTRYQSVLGFQFKV